jgi:peptidylprolyl isomerase
MLLLLALLLTAEVPEFKTEYASVQLAPGTGTTSPGADDLVKVRHTIWRSDGKVLEKIPENRAAIMSVSRMMPGWRTAVETMVAGEKRRVWIPSSLSGGKVAEGLSLVIDTELLEVIKGPTTPPDVAAPPADAQTTRSGLASKVLKPGTGTRKPGRRSTVRVNYSGWQTDGRLFDSTLLRGTPAEFRLDQVISGWTEGMTMMVEGETRRFWIPAKLAYASDPEKPQGMLVFDIELLSVK